MSEMVERVARILYAADPVMTRLDDPDGRPMAPAAELSWEEVQDDVGLVEHYSELARAAIEAMVEPTRAMKDAALAKLTNPTVDVPQAAAWDAVQAYRAMLTAALA